MARKARLFLPLDVNFLEDDRIIVAGDGPTLLFVAMMLRSKALGSDGRLSEAQVTRLHRPRWRSEMKRLLDLELVILEGGSGDFQITSWLRHNESVELRSLRLAADRGRKQQKAGKFQPESTGNPNGIRHPQVPDSSSRSREERSEVRNSARNDAPPTTTGARCLIHRDLFEPCETCEAQRVEAGHPPTLRSVS